ncbi:FtsX-like permease family protein [Streptomyces sp. NPDC003697]
MTGNAGFVLSRARAHRLLLAAVLLSVLLTTAVLATLTAYSGAIGDAALRHSLSDPRNAADATLIVKADVPRAGRAAADAAVRKEGRAAFDGLPVTVRTLLRSGPYALPRSPRSSPAGGAAADPDLTYLAALDRAQVRIAAGRMPGRGTGDLEVALPETAAGRLGLRPGSRLTLTDRLGGSPAHVRVTGLYRPVDAEAPYWRLDPLDGRGIRKVDFTMYGPMLTDPGVLAGGAVSEGQSAWQVSADFSALTTGRIDALRDAVRAGGTSLGSADALGGAPVVTTALPDVLDRIDRSLFVSRSTLLIAALQLALLAGCALLLVARLLSTERAPETRLLLARGGSRARVAGLAAAEALLLAVPSVVCAPLLAGPLTRLLAEQGALARIGLRPETSALGRPGVWLVAVGVALGCASAVTLPVLTSSFTAGRTRTLPAPLRAGADLGLLAVAAVAYWRLDSQPSGAAGDGALGVDPLVVVAPALALLAGTVLTLRLLPPVARLAERRAARGRGLPAALAGWQFGRRPMRGAGPVLLLVLAVALGILAIGQGASWDRSQDDQADFRAGTPVRVLAAGEGDLGRTEQYAAVPDVRAVAPAVRTALQLSGDRTASVLAVDTAHAADAVLMRSDLAPAAARPLGEGLAPKGVTAGAGVPSGTVRLRLTAAVQGAATGTTADTALTLEDRYGTPYRLPAGRLSADGRAHTLPVPLPPSAGPLTLTALDLTLIQPVGSAERHRLAITRLTATDAHGTARQLALPTAWKATSSSSDPLSSPDRTTRPVPPPRVTSSRPLTVAYGTGYVPAEESSLVAALTVRLQVPQPAVPAITAVATDRFLTSAGARVGQRVEVILGGRNLPVRIVRAVRELPTAGGADGPAATGSAGPDGGGSDGGALLVDLRSVNRALQARYGESVAPTEWWLRTGPGTAPKVAAALRALPDLDPTQVVVRDEIAAQLRNDPFGAGAAAAFAAAAVVAAALAAVGFAVSAAGSLRERDAEFAVLRALGAPRRRLARTIAAEQGVLVTLALMVGVALGTVLTRAVVPLIVLTAQATRPVPTVLVELPATRVAVLLAAVAVAPLAVTAALMFRRTDPAASLRNRGGE